MGWIGYLALGMSLWAVTKRNMRAFRWLHLMASVLYIAYGLSIEAYPIAIGGSIFMMIHVYHLWKMAQTKV